MKKESERGKTEKKLPFSQEIRRGVLSPALNSRSWSGKAEALLIWRGGTGGFAFTLPDPWLPFFDSFLYGISIFREIQLRESEKERDLLEAVTSNIGGWGVGKAQQPTSTIRIKWRTLWKCSDAYLFGEKCISGRFTAGSFHFINELLSESCIEICF